METFENSENPILDAVRAHVVSRDPSLVGPERDITNEIASDPIIIYGAPRSGTTYLRAVLSEHPNIFISQETRVFSWARQALHIDLNDERYFMNHRAEFRELFIPRLREIIREFYWMTGRGSYYWGDKNPHYCQYPDQLESILRLFASARFIHLIRDGRDVVASLMSKGWADFPKAHKVWTGFVETGANFGRQLPPSQYYEVRYEELFSDGPAVAADILTFLNIPMDARVERYCLRQTIRRTQLSAPTRSASLLNVNRSQWETVLDADQRAESMSLLGPHLEKWGYLDGDREIGSARRSRVSRPSIGINPRAASLRKRGSR